MSTQTIRHAQDSRPAIPAFADNTKLRLALGTLLYLAQGFPQGIFFVGGLITLSLSKEVRQPADASA